MDLPFTGSAQTILISVTSTPSAAVLIPGLGHNLRMTNLGPNKAFFGIGGSTVTSSVPTGTASANSTPLVPGVDIFSRNRSLEQYVSLVCASGETATVCVQSGEGL